MLSMFRAGGTVVLHDFLLAKSALKAMENHEINVLGGVPPLWAQLLEVDWPDAVRRRMRVLTNSGGAMPPSLSHRLRAHCPDARLYLMRSEEHTSELQSLMRISYAVFCLKKKKTKAIIQKYDTNT